VLSAVELPGALQVGQMAADTVRVSGPVGRPVQVQFRTAGAPWRTAVTLVTNSRHRVRVAVAVTTTGGRLVWQAHQHNGLRAVAGRTTEPVGLPRVRPGGAGVDSGGQPG
jgi:glucose dehydrogenase